MLQTSPWRNYCWRVCIERVHSAVPRIYWLDYTCTGLFKSSLIGKREKQGVCSDWLKRVTRCNSKYRDYFLLFPQCIEPVLRFKRSMQHARGEGRKNTKNCHLNRETRVPLDRVTYLFLPPPSPSTQQPPTRLNALTDPASLLLFVFEFLNATCTCLIASLVIPVRRLTPWTRVFFRVWTRTPSCCHRVDVALMKGWKSKLSMRKHCWSPVFEQCFNSSLC